MWPTPIWSPSSISLCVVSKGRSFLLWETGYLRVAKHIGISKIRCFQRISATTATILKCDIGNTIACQIHYVVSTTHEASFGMAFKYASHTSLVDAPVGYYATQCVNKCISHKMKLFFLVTKASCHGSNDNHKNTLRYIHFAFALYFFQDYMRNIIPLLWRRITCTSMWCRF